LMRNRRVLYSMRPAVVEQHDVTMVDTSSLGVLKKVLVGKGP
jgi:hypothetical protein